MINSAKPGLEWKTKTIEGMTRDASAAKLGAAANG
jgi:hypothetical protein